MIFSKDKCPVCFEKLIYFVDIFSDLSKANHYRCKAGHYLCKFYAKNDKIAEFYLRDLRFYFWLNPDAEGVYIWKIISHDEPEELIYKSFKILDFNWSNKDKIIQKLKFITVFS
jgi:hypothetical protein